MWILNNVFLRKARIDLDFGFFDLEELEKSN